MVAAFVETEGMEVPTGDPGRLGPPCTLGPAVCQARCQESRVLVSRQGKRKEEPQSLPPWLTPKLLEGLCPSNCEVIGTQVIELSSL